MVVGVLALQGGYALHEDKFRKLGVQTNRVVRPSDFDAIAGLVIPGGESSTLLKIGTPELWDRLRLFSKSHPIWGTCAGAIMIASKVENPPQEALCVINMTIKRNAYGTQNDSFITTLNFELSEPFTAECIFIRAPQIVDIGDGVTIVAKHENHPVMIEQGAHMATTFHPELTDQLEVHRYFLNKLSKN